jgi:hypothetical protein
MPTLRNKRTGEIITIPDGQQQALPPNPIREEGAKLGNVGKGLENELTAVKTKKDERDLRQTPISAEDQKIIDAMRTNVGGMSDTLNLLHGAAGTIDRFRTGPERAATVRSAVTPPDATFSDTILPRFMKWWQGVPEKDIEDYQSLQRYSQEGVLQKQIAQKGPQTESDAIRMLMSGISPDKSVNVNAKIVGDAMLSGLVAQKKPDFYAKWANRNGSIGALEGGKSVDQAWNERVQRAMSKYNADPRIRRLTGEEGLTGSVTDTGDYTPYEGGGWKIERVED